MQRLGWRPRAWLSWEAVKPRSASSPIPGQHLRDVTTRHVQRLNSSSSHGDDSNTLAQDRKRRDTTLHHELEHFRRVKEAAIRSGVTGKDRTMMAAKGYTSPISNIDRQVESELNDSSSRPIEVLQRCIQSGTASPHVLHACFEAQYRDQARYIRRLRPQIHKTQREDQLARTALIHMLRDPGEWTSVLHKNTALVDNLCYFAVIEGLQETMIQLLKLEPVPDNPFWRSKVATGLILAENVLDLNKCADACLNLFFTFWDLQTAARTRKKTQLRGTTKIPVLAKYDLIRGAAVKLRVVLTSNEAPLGSWQTDPALYERFLQYCVCDMPRERKFPPEEVEWMNSDFQLYHPAGYNEGPALELLKKYAKKGQYAFLPDAAQHGPHIAQSIAKFVRRTADVAEANSNMAAARWVFNTFEEEYSSAKPRSLERIEGTAARLGSSATYVQRRLLNASMRTVAASKKLLSDKVERAPAVQVASDPTAHAAKFQNMLGTVPKEGKEEKLQKRGFGL